MLLMEQLKSIKKELGMEKDDKSALLQRFAQRWEPKRDTAPEEARRVVQVRQPMSLGTTKSQCIYIVYSMPHGVQVWHAAVTLVSYCTAAAARPCAAQHTARCVKALQQHA